MQLHKADNGTMGRGDAVKICSKSSPRHRVSPSPPPPLIQEMSLKTRPREGLGREIFPNRSH